MVKLFVFIRNLFYVGIVVYNLSNNFRIDIGLVILVFMWINKNYFCIVEDVFFW